MPGSLCNGTPTDQPYVRESNAYCEGREAATAGLLIGSNPHPAGTRDNALWAAGHASYNGGLGTPYVDCCASPGYS